MSVGRFDNYILIKKLGHSFLFSLSPSVNTFHRSRLKMYKIFLLRMPWKGGPSIPYPFNYFEKYPISLK